VINGTGVILHTNLGRSPIHSKLYDGLKDAVCGYSNLEFSIGENKRSKRGALAGRILAALAGAEAGMVVNNNASSVYMAVANLAMGKEVIISRGQLIQIGGGFRIPDIIERSGAKLKEIGTTNKTDLNDYKKAINKNTGLILIVHKSNFTQSGFTEEPETSEIVNIAKTKKIPLCFDLGSGMPALDDFKSVVNEPDIMTGVRTGADLVCFSGDKLFGGPQAGLIVGKQKYINALLKDPLYRVMRPDKLTLGLIEKTLLSYLKNDSNTINWSMASISINTLKKRANKIIKAVDNINISAVNLKSSFGGGSLPGYEFESYGLKITGKATSLSNKLRKHNPPVISRTVSNGILIDLRTVLPTQDKIVIEAIQKCL
jgi:L-seryl-tRNA(Ser) seleniumtransferase